MNSFYDFFNANMMNEMYPITNPNMMNPMYMFSMMNMQQRSTNCLQHNSIINIKPVNIKELLE